MGGALDVPGSDLSPRSGERGRALDPSDPFYLSFIPPLQPPCAPPSPVRGFTEYDEGGGGEERGKGTKE